MANSITLPPNLRRCWFDVAQLNYPGNPSAWIEYVADLAAQWGADQELEACVELANEMLQDGNSLRATRRRQPPSLKEQALASLAELESPGRCDEPGYESLCSIIRRALEALDD
jgi:hypothetical protein